MKTALVLSVLCAIACAAPSVSLVGSPLIASPLWARASPLIAHAPLIAAHAPLVSSVAAVNPIATPLLAKVEGEAPASTVHAEHVKQVVVPQVIVPAPAPQIISYSLPAPAHQVISAYSLPAPVVSPNQSFI